MYSYAVVCARTVGQMIWP